MNKLRIVFAAAMICLVVSSIAVYALTSWTKTFTWGSGFQVYHEDQTTVWAEDPEILNSSTNTNFWVLSVADFPITVNVNYIVKFNCTDSWTSLSQTIPSHEGRWFNLTLTPDLNEPNGCYSFTFGLP